MDIKVIYEMNPPKVLYNNFFDHDTINKNIELFMSRAKKVSEYVDGIHLTDNVLGVPRISSLMLVSMLKKIGISKPITLYMQTLRQKSYINFAICLRGYIVWSL